jgi:regulatory protein
MYTIEEFDKEKTKVLKYVIYKKRTQKEVEKKFKGQIEPNMLEDIIEELKENGYISDVDYIVRTINEYMSLKNLSIKELKYKLLSKGINSNMLDDYINSNINELEEYEKKSAENIAIKKSVNMDETEIITYLMKKGYKEENIKEAIANLED